MTFLRFPGRVDVGVKLPANERLGAVCVAASGHPLPSKSSSTMPKLANRTPFTFVVVSFLGEGSQLCRRS